MARLFEQLVKDHVNMLKVFDALERQVDAYSDDAEADLGLILDALEYVSSYPEKFHHPLEEKAFDYLESHHIGDPNQIEMIRKQHVVLEQKTHRLNERFDEIANDCLVSMTEVKKEFGDYISMQRRHIKNENETVFPLLRQLSDEVWWFIAGGLSKNPDPLFNGDPSFQQFEQLAESVFSGEAVV